MQIITIFMVIQINADNTSYFNLLTDKSKNYMGKDAVDFFNVNNK